MRLAALKTGAGVPAGDFGGPVRSVFRRALILDAGEAGLITLAPAEAGGLPAGISTALPADFAFAGTVQPGQEAAARGGLLRIAGSGLGIDLSGAVRWRAGLDRLRLSLAAPASLAAFTQVARLLAANRGAAALLAIARRPILSLVQSARRGDAHESAQSALALVGLGAGGTPAGDDFLVGFLAALHSGGPHIDHFRRSLGDAVAAASGRTNAVSGVYLRAASIGEVSERLSNVAAALASGTDARDAGAAAIAVGHTSGADGVLGLLAGATVTAPDESPFRRLAMQEG